MDRKARPGNPRRDRRLQRGGLPLDMAVAWMVGKAPAGSRGEIRHHHSEAGAPAVGTLSGAKGVGARHRRAVEPAYRRHAAGAAALRPRRFGALAARPTAVVAPTGAEVRLVGLL